MRGPTSRAAHAARCSGRCCRSSQSPCDSLASLACRAWLSAFGSRLGRPGGTRTPNTRFSRPVLYQLSYWPTVRSVGLLLLLVRSVLAAERTELLQLDPLRRLLLVLGRAVVATLALAARHMNDVSHRSI